jgi:uncharacterized paraquat-inducible protein A
MPTPPRYSRGQRYCGHCCEWISDAGARCPRCGYTLRLGPRKYSRRKRTQPAEKPAIATE